MKALIMAGGQGTRFWPLSTPRNPKQFLRLLSDRTMLQETADRLRPLVSDRDIFVVAPEVYVEEVRRQLPQLGSEQVIVEPAPRNTAPCIGLACRYLLRRFGDEPVAVLPADHRIGNVAAFHAALRAAERLANEGWMVTFGIRPAYPATGYGYIRRGEEMTGNWGLPAYRVERFTEKPDRATAEKFLAEGRYDWNSGMFMWKPSILAEELRRHAPEIAEGLERLDAVAGDDEARRLFASLPKLSIDYAVMEKTDRAVVIPCDLDWSDVGSWAAVRDLRPADEAGMVVSGRVENVGSRNCTVFGQDDKVVALVGVQDLVVVDTPGGLLICAAGETERVREVVERLQEKEVGVRS
ncbi:MAG: mannose-1-phosphate guanylyltransferase [Acidobacteriota bacterium]